MRHHRQFGVPGRFIDAKGCRARHAEFAVERRQPGDEAGIGLLVTVLGPGKAGLARGGSLDNAIVVDGSNILNSGGLRMANEFASHKLLDAVGDLALAGVRLHGHFSAYRPGHGLNNRLLRALFADAAALRKVTAEPLTVAA